MPPLKEEGGDKETSKVCSYVQEQTYFFPLMQHNIIIRLIVLIAALATSGD